MAGPAVSPPPSPRPKREPRKPLLSVADALDFAADEMLGMANNQSLIALIVGVAKDKPDVMSGMPSELRGATIDPDKQEQVMRDTARILRDLAVEHRILDMRELERLRSERSQNSD